MHQSEVQMEDWLPCSECKKERSSTGFAVKGKLIQYSLLTVCICSFVLTVFVVCNSFIKDTGQQRILEDVAQLMQKQIQLEKSFANLQMRLVTSEKRNAALQTRLHKTDKSLNKLRNAFGRSLKYSPSFESGYNSIASMDVFSANNTYANGMDTTLNDLPASHEDIEYQASNNHNRVRRKASSNSKKRNNGKKSKGCKNCLPAVQIHGDGGLKSVSSNPNGQANRWTEADWVLTDKLSQKTFDASNVFNDGKVKVKKSGLYLIYSQLTMTGDTKQGYELMKNRDIKLATCITPSSGDPATSSFACATTCIVKLNKNDVIHVQEMTTNTGAIFEDSTSFFGLLRVGN